MNTHQSPNALKLKFALLLILAAFIFGWVIMLLWNWLMPYLFDARIINYWQALGLLVLCKILFGGIRKGGWNQRNYNYKDYWKKGMEERMKSMTPEEREKFKKDFYEKCKNKWNFDCPDETEANAS